MLLLDQPGPVDLAQAVELAGSALHGLAVLHHEGHPNLRGDTCQGSVRQYVFVQQLRLYRLDLCELLAEVLRYGGSTDEDFRRPDIDEHCVRGVMPHEAR